MLAKKSYNLDKFYSKIYKRYDLINKIFTFGLDRKWRRILVEKTLQDSPGMILDLCCGTGDITIALRKKAGSKIQITGCDFNKQMLNVAESKSIVYKYFDIDFVQGDASNLPFEDNTFDRITISFGFRNLTYKNPNKEKHIDEILRVLKPNGRLLVLESGVPKNKFIRLFYKAYLYLIMMPIGGLISGQIRAYWYLAHSSIRFYSVVEVKNMLKEKGFRKIGHRSFFLGATNLFVASKY